MCSDTMLERPQRPPKLTWFDADKCFIDGRWVAPQSGGLCRSKTHRAGSRSARSRVGRNADIDAAVEAAERALAGAWGRLTATERGRLLAKLAELIRARVDDLARIEAIDVGKPLKQGRADALAMARYMEFYAGAADKVMGETIPYLDGYTVYTLREPHGVTGTYRAVELSDADRRAHHRRGAGDGQRLRPEAGGGSLPHVARARRPRARSRLSARRAQCRSRPRRGGGRGARRPSRHPTYLLHRLGRGWRVGSGGGGPPCRARDARAWRQVAATRFRRRRPRARAAVPGQCGHPERRPDLLGRLAHSDRASDLSGRRRTHGGALQGLAGRPGGRRSRSRSA